MSTQSSPTLHHSTPPIADLFYSYNDDVPAKTATTTAPEPTAPAPAAEATVKPEDEPNNDSSAQPANDDAGNDYHMGGAEEYEDDDDDVDFNLGNGASGPPDTPSYNSAPTPAPHRGPNAKEDG